MELIIKKNYHPIDYDEASEIQDWLNLTSLLSVNIYQNCRSMLIFAVVDLTPEYISDEEFDGEITIQRIWWF